MSFNVMIIVSTPHTNPCPANAAAVLWHADAATSATGAWDFVSSGSDANVN